jgi:acyl-CoA dehydrogenase
MEYLYWLIAVVIIIGITSALHFKLFNATLAIGFTLLVGSILDIVGFFSWVIFLTIAIFLNSPSLRREHLTKRVLAIYRKITPEMSDTEKDAINAGTVWWDGDLFSGAPNWQKMHNIPQPRLSAEEQAFLDGPVEEVARMIDEWEINHERADLSPEVWQYLKDNKFFAMIIKKEYGGLEFSAYAQSRVLQKLSGMSIVLSSTVGVPNSLGPGELLQLYGTDEQKKRYLPGLANGEEIPCFALTGPEAGSDAGAIPDKGIICKGEWDGEEVVGMKLTFDKRYITLAPVATVVGLAFKLHDPEGLIGDTEDLGITCALIPANTEGLDIGNRHFPLNVPFQNGPIRGKDIFVPLDYIIGGQKNAGKGWRMLVECLSVGRVITLPSSAAGGAKTTALATGAYARIRRQFKLPIGKMEGIEEMLGRIGGNAYLMDAVTSFSTKAVDLGEKPSVISAICKYHLTEKMRILMMDTMDIHAGKGVMLGPKNYLGRGYQGAPIAITVEGANILTRNMMIYGQGAMRSHPFVLKELLAASQEDERAALNDFDEALFGHLGFVCANFFRSFWFGWTNSSLASTPFTDGTKGYYQSLSRFSANLALLSDILMGLLGGELKRKERLSARLGDVLSFLYLASATLKRFDDEGRQNSDLPLLHWAMQDSLYQLENAIDELLKNFPNKYIGWFIRLFIMPFGKTHSRPSDEIEHQIATILQTPCESRSRLGTGQCLSREPNNLFGELEQTLEDIISAEPIYDRICKETEQKHSFVQLDKLADIGLEANIISTQEAAILIRAETGRLSVIAVDDFSSSELAVNKTGIESRTKEQKR